MWLSLLISASAAAVAAAAAAGGGAEELLRMAEGLEEEAVGMPGFGVATKDVMAAMESTKLSNQVDAHRSKMQAAKQPVVVQDSSPVTKVAKLEEERLLDIKLLAIKDTPEEAYRVDVVKTKDGSKYEAGSKWSKYVKDKNIQILEKKRAGEGISLAALKKELKASTEARLSLEVMLNAVLDVEHSNKGTVNKHHIQKAREHLHTAWGYRYGSEDERDAAPEWEQELDRLIDNTYTKFGHFYGQRPVNSFND